MFKIPVYGFIIGVLIIVAAVALFACFSTRNTLKKLRRNYDKKLKNERRFYGTIEREGSEAFAMVRRSDRAPLYVSGQMERIFGIPTDQLTKDMEAFQQIVERPVYRSFLQELEKWDYRSDLYFEFPFQNPENGRKGYGKVVLTPDDAGENIIMVFADISDEYKKRREIEERMQALEKENQSKITFLSNMSHEIRTPMNGVLGMLSLTRINLDKRQEAEDYLAKAESLSQYLLSLINDILDVSRIESGKVVLEQASFDLYGMAERLDAMFRGTIEEKGIRFDIKMEDIKARYVVGDEMRLNQVIINFISNSLKFTPQGGLIEITYRQLHILDGQVNLMIRVRDTGKGIEPEFLSRIFKPFEQESTQVTKKYGGSGLGMNIADNLIRLMGGQIVIDSEVGKGSDFTVYLSLPVGEAPAGSAESDVEIEPFTFDGKHILLAEDNDINAEIAIDMLDMMGAMIVRAVNGIEAVEKFAAAATGTYDLIFMDIQMPEMNGYEAARKIRSLEKSDASSIPIIALSADAFVEDKRRSIESGMNGHIAKPIDFSKLEENVTEILAGHALN